VCVSRFLSIVLFFFFQAEDGIRDFHVTGVQTCALPISRSDGLLGLKENIIIGKLIPAGTGMERYRNVNIEAPDYQPMDYYSSASEDQDLADWLAGQSGGSGLVDVDLAAGD